MMSKEQSTWIVAALDTREARVMGAPKSTSPVWLKEVAFGHIRCRSCEKRAKWRSGLADTGCVGSTFGNVGFMVGDIWIRVFLLRT